MNKLLSILLIVVLIVLSSSAHLSKKARKAVAKTKDCNCLANKATCQANCRKRSCFDNCDANYESCTC
jgi:hypothetical protein